MTASLSSHPALVSRSLSRRNGAIIGGTIGAAVGLILALLCLLPFVVRARRRQRRGETLAARAADDAAIPQHVRAPHPPFSPFAQPPFPRPPPDVKYGQPPFASPYPPPAGQPPQALYVPGAGGVPLGLPSPITPPTQPFPTFPPFGTDAPRSHSYDTELSPIDVGPAPRSPLSPSLPAPPDGTFVFPGPHATAEPDALERAGGSSQLGSRQGSRRLSDSVRQLAHVASAAVRRNSTLSTSRHSDTTRSPTAAPDELVATLPPAHDRIEPADMDARGEAYSYYHDTETLPPHGPYHDPSIPIPPPHPPPPPTSPPFAFPATRPPPTSQGPATAPISPVSPPSGYAFDPRPTFGFGSVEPPGLPDIPPEPVGRGPPVPRPLDRTDTLPAQPIVSDMGSPPLEAEAAPSANPMDIMRPTTDTEMGWMVEQELVKISHSPPPPGAPQSPPHLLLQEPASQQPTSQPTPEPSPGREASPPSGPPIERATETVGGRAHADPTVWTTPPPSSAVSSGTTPDRLLDSGPTPDASTSSPGTNGASSERSGSSPRLYQCEECHRVFNQYHKLNHHKRYHDRPHQCPHQDCHMRFGTKTHLDRHINDKHKKTKKYYCTQPKCPYSRHGGRSFPRKDNWRRHMQKKHNLAHVVEPGPEFVDEIMSGT